MTEETNAVAGPADGEIAGPAAEAGMAERALELLHAGGPVVAILLVLSVVALAIVFVKLMQFRGHRLGDRRTRSYGCGGPGASTRRWRACADRGTPLPGR